MIDKLWEKVSRYMSIMPLGVLFGLVAFVTQVEVKDLDLWLHLAMGKFITLHHYVPTVDILSCSIAGSPWVNHEWLFQVLVHHLYQGWGVHGLMAMQTGLVITTLSVLVLMGYHRDRHLLITFLLFVVFMVYQQRFTMRPDLFSLLFLCVYIYMLSTHIHRRSTVWILCVLQVIWTNMHGFFFFGPFMMMVGVFSEWMKRRIPLPYEWNDMGRLTDDEYGRMKILFLITGLACLVNPLFIEGAIYPLKVFLALGREHQMFFKYIEELQAPLTRETFLSTSEYGYYKLLIIFSFVTFIFNRRRIDISALFLWGIFLVFSAKAIRNMPFFAVAAYMVIVSNLVHLSTKDFIPLKFTQAKFRYLTQCFLSLLFVSWFINYYSGIASKKYYDFDQYAFKSAFGGISLAMYPDKAVDFLVEQQIKGNFLNEFNSGAYLLGRTFPDIKVFIDGRTEVYGKDFFEKYYPIWQKDNVPLMEEAIERFDITGVLLNSARQHIPSAIIKHLYQSSDWILVFFDEDGVVFLKDIPEYKEVIDAYAVDLTSRFPTPTDLVKIGGVDVLPYPHFYRAFTLESMGLVDQALAEARLALTINPLYKEVYELIGKIYAQKKEFKRAMEYFRLAVVMRPHQLQNWYNLAQVYRDMERYPEALKAFENIQHQWPQEVRPLFVLAQIYIQMQQYSKAVLVATEAFQRDPKAFKDILKLGDLLYEKKAFTEAIALYVLISDGSKSRVEALEKQALAWQGLGDVKHAAALFKEVLVLDPAREGLQERLEALDFKNAVEKSH